MKVGTLVDRAKKGDSEAIGKLYALYRHQAYSVAFNFTRNSCEAEDVVQDVFLKIFQKIHTFENRSHFTTWLTRITINFSLMSLRKTKTRNEASLELLVESDDNELRRKIGRDDPAKSLAGERARLRKALDQLPPLLRESFILFDIVGYEHKEISRMLGITIASSKARVFRARKNLKRIFRQTLTGAHHKS